MDMNNNGAGITVQYQRFIHNYTFMKYIYLYINPPEVAVDLTDTYVHLFLNIFKQEHYSPYRRRVAVVQHIHSLYIHRSGLDCYLQIALVCKQRDAVIADSRE